MRHGPESAIEVVLVRLTTTNLMKRTLTDEERRCRGLKKSVLAFAFEHYPGVQPRKRRIQRIKVSNFD